MRTTAGELNPPASASVSALAVVRIFIENKSIWNRLSDENKFIRFGSWDRCGERLLSRRLMNFENVLNFREILAFGYFMLAE